MRQDTDGWGCFFKYHLTTSLHTSTHTTLTQNPGFDFSNAQFNGSVPDPQSFMGGVKY